MVLWKLEEAATPCESDIDFSAKIEQAEVTKEVKDLIYTPATLDLYRKYNGVYKIKGVKFKNVSFKSTEVCNFQFSDCTFEKCIFIATKFKKCEFYTSQFFETNFAYCEFYDTYIDPKLLNNLFTTQEANLAVRVYQNLLDSLHSSSQIEYARQAEYFFYKWKHAFIKNKMISMNTNVENNGTSLNKVKLRKIKNENIVYNIYCAVGYGIDVISFVRTIGVLFSLCIIINFLGWEFYNIKLPVDVTSKNLWIVVQYTFYTFASYGATPYAATSAFGIVIAIMQGILGWIIVGTGLAMIIKKIVR